MDLSVRFHEHTPSTALGPAAGPQTQMAQNIVLSYLAGCRVMELKTVQINDRLEIGRPCIDMENVGYNIEWSQELRIQESLEEYVKAWMLITMLRHEVPEFGGSQGDVVFDMSVGYDLAGIQSPSVRAFMDGMLDASEIIERLRAEIPDELAHLRDLDYPAQLSNTLTLSTFHGCPPDEIERIIDWLLETYGIHCIVKLNPTLLGKDDGRALLNETLGYTDCVIPDHAFEEDTSWSQMVAFIGRLGDKADSLGLSFGVKFSNTQIVENHKDFFPAEETQMYLSGPPLHVLAIELVRRFRGVFGDRFPISFSAGIDRKNFADAVAIGLVPVTTCSDLLKPGGYGRGESYLRNLVQRMQKLNVSCIDDFVVTAYGHAMKALEQAKPSDEQRTAATRALAEGTPLADAVDAAFFARWRSAAVLMNTESYADAVVADARYHQAKNKKIPRKIESTLVLLDCITCDKCIPVCPNHANFAYTLPLGTIPVTRMSLAGNDWRAAHGEPLEVSEAHQLGNFVDFCNECGNCDIFCPELGGPYKLKPRFHSSLERFEADAGQDGLFLTPTEAYGRFEGAVYRTSEQGGRVLYSGPGFSVTFDGDAPEETMDGEAVNSVDLTYWRLLTMVRDSVYDEGEVNYLRALHGNLKAPASA
ncbi:MAG: 4Fe-4S dicluster domain-containing protein [Myxococcota bacterium]